MAMSSWRSGNDRLGALISEWIIVFSQQLQGFKSSFMNSCMIIIDIYIMVMMLSSFLRRVCMFYLYIQYNDVQLQFRDFLVYMINIIIIIPCFDYGMFKGQLQVIVLYGNYCTCFSFGFVSEHGLIITNSMAFLFENIIFLDILSDSGYEPETVDIIRHCSAEIPTFQLRQRWRGYSQGFPTQEEFVELLMGVMLRYPRSLLGLIRG